MKRTIVFPPVKDADEDGLVAVGGDLACDTLEVAYRQGIFPWPISVELPLAWFSLDPRGVIDVTDFHLPQSYRKWHKKHSFTVTMNQAFEQVIRGCAITRRKGQPSTWITPDIIRGYTEFHRQGKAYSIEVWNQEKNLVGGLYGVCLDNFYSGESMFSLEDNASKLALHWLMEYLPTQNVHWLDTQMVTPLVRLFGGKEIPRGDFLKRLETSFKRT